MTCYAAHRWLLVALGYSHLFAEPPIEIQQAAYAQSLRVADRRLPALAANRVITGSFAGELFLVKRSHDGYKRHTRGLGQFFLPHPGVLYERIANQRIIGVLGVNALGEERGNILAKIARQRGQIDNLGSVDSVI